MSIGARELTILGDFQPFGLIAEALDGKPSDACVDDYRYFLFTPEVTKQRDEADELDLPSPSDRSDHELFIRGNKYIYPLKVSIFQSFLFNCCLSLQNCHQHSRNSQFLVV